MKITFTDDALGDGAPAIVLDKLRGLTVAVIDTTNSIVLGTGPIARADDAYLVLEGPQETERRFDWEDIGEVQYQ